MVYAEFGGQTECIMGNWKIENGPEINRFGSAVLNHNLLCFVSESCIDAFLTDTHLIIKQVTFIFGLK